MSRRRPGPVLLYYRTLRRRYGPQGWWPGRSRFEIIIGAILTQNVAWKNVEMAIGHLRRADLLAPRRMSREPISRLARLIRPAGAWRAKARTIRGFLRLLEARHRGDLRRLFRQPTPVLRAELLGLRGIGPETADSILLYAGDRATFVVDAYTRRILERHGVLRGSESYAEAQATIEQALPREARLFNEYHALLVRVGKEHCFRREPHCGGCPLRAYLTETR